MSNNLFLVHTPMQLFVAQQIIHQEKLENNILLYGYVPGNKHFQEIYQYMIIPEMWKEQIPRTIEVGWALVDFHHFFSSVRVVKRNFKVINAFIRNKQVGAIYMGDIANRGNQLLANIYHNTGIKIVFFEEGLSHYISVQVEPPKSFSQKLIKNLRILFLDNILFKPLWGFPYAKQFYYEYVNRDDIPMDVRYSILPYYKQSYDKQLIVRKLLSPKLKFYLDNEISAFLNMSQGKRISLFLSSPIYEATSSNDIPLIIDVVDDFVKTLGNEVVMIKFHPRETASIKDQIIHCLESNNISYCIISQTINIPVEYYLQFVSFDIIYSFGSSTTLYSGYIYDSTPSVRLDKMFLQKCILNKSKGVHNIEKYCAEFDAIQSLFVKDGR